MYFRKLRGSFDYLCTSIDNENKAHGYVRELQRFEVYFGVRILHRIFGKVHAVHNAIKSKSMSLGECSSIVAALTAALRIDGESVDIFSVFMTSCKSSALAMGIDLPAVPRGLAKRVNRGNRVDWEIYDIVVNNYYHGIWTKLYNSLVGSLKLKMIQWNRLCKISNPTKHTTDLKYLHKYLSEKFDHRLM